MKRVDGTDYGGASGVVRRCGLGVALLSAMSIVVVGRVGDAAGKDKAPAPPATADQRDAAAFAQLAKAWSDCFAGRHEEAIKTALPLTTLGERRLEWVKYEAAHICARSYFAPGKQQSKAKAGRSGSNWRRARSR